MLIGRINGFERVRETPFRFLELSIGVVGQSGNPPWVKGHTMGRQLRQLSPRKLGRKYVCGVVSLMVLWEYRICRGLAGLRLL